VSARSRSIHARRGGSGLRGMPAVSTKSEMKERADFLIGYLIGVEYISARSRCTVTIQTAGRQVFL
jgi:hypothetical protein